MSGLRICFLVSLISLLCLPSLSWGFDQSDREKIQKEYEAADLNKDGYVDENEYKAFISGKFGSADKSKNQKTDKNGPAGREAGEFVVRDEGKDYKVTFKEFLNGRLRFFNEADANHDTLLSLEEYTKMRVIDPVK